MIILLVLSILFFQSCLDKNNTIKVKGSDTEVNLAVSMAEAFHNQNKQLLVSISGGGSGLGIASLLNGNADIANSSREINEKELVLFKQKNIELRSFVFAQDAIAFVVSKTLKLDSIHIKDLALILSGTEQNWNFLTQTNRPINIYGRQNNSGTYEYIKNKLNIKFSTNALQMSGNAQILEAIKVDNSGIGYVGAGYIMNGNHKDLQVLKIYNDNTNAISPLDTKKILSGEYYFQRPLYQYYKKSDFKRIKPIFDFEKTKTGKKIIELSGYYPTNKKNEKK